MYHSVWWWELFEIFSWVLTLQYGNLGGFSPGSSSSHGRTCGPRWTCFRYFKSWCTISWTSACVSVQVRYATPHSIDSMDSSSMSVSHETFLKLYIPPAVCPPDCLYRVPHFSYITLFTGMQWLLNDQGFWSQLLTKFSTCMQPCLVFLQLSEIWYTFLL